MICLFIWKIKTYHPNAKFYFTNHSYDLLRYLYLLENCINDFFQMNNMRLFKIDIKMGFFWQSIFSEQAENFEFYLTIYILNKKSV